MVLDPKRPRRQYLRTLPVLRSRNVEGHHLQNPSLLSLFSLRAIATNSQNQLRYMRKRNVYGTTETESSEFGAVQHQNRSHHHRNPSHKIAGIQLFIKGQAGIFPSYFAYPFGIGDLFIGLFALPMAYMLRTGGTGKYALVIAWNSVGLADLLFASTVASYGGLNPTIITDLQTALVVVPVSMLLHVVTIALLITKPLKQFFSESSV